MMTGRFVDSKQSSKKHKHSSSIDTVSDSSVTSSTDRDFSSTEPGINFKHTGVINVAQVSYEKILPSGRNIDSNSSNGDSKATASDTDDNVTAKETYALQESDSKSDDDVSNSLMQEEPTITHSTKTVVVGNERTLILDDQSTNPDAPTNVESHDQCDSGSQSISETVPMEAQDSGSHFITASSGHQNVGSESVAVDAVDTRLVTGQPVLSSVASSDTKPEAQSDRVVVVPKPVEMAEVVWVHPQSKLTLHSVYEVGQYTELPRRGDFLGGGGNGEVYKCFVNIPGKEEELCLAYKIEKKKPLNRPQNQVLFDKICKLQNEKHFVIIHAYLVVKCHQDKLHPYGYIGYLLMEYFPLGSITANLKKFQHDKGERLKTLNQLSWEIEKMEADMREKENRTDDEFGKYRKQWCSLKRQKEKVAAWCQHIIRGVMETIRKLHERKLMHLDIKDHNFLLRKTCDHKELFICDCTKPSFDVLIGDYDYAHELGDNLLNPKSIGTRDYKAPQTKHSRSQRTAQPCLDLYSNMVTIIRVACKMSWRSDDICMDILKLWESLLLYSSNFELELANFYKDLWMILNYIQKLENANHFDSDRHQCNEGCEFFKNEIAFCARKLVIPPQHRFQYEATNQMMQLGSTTLIMGYSNAFLKHGLSCFKEDGMLSYMKDVLYDTVEDCSHR